MQRYQNLEFFNKSGNSCNFSYDNINNKWIGTIFIPKISVGLIETEQIFIYERVLNEIGREVYVYPHINNILLSNEVKVYLNNTIEPQFFLFNTTNNFINKSTDYYVNFDLDNSETIYNDYKQTTLLNQYYLNINIGFSSEIEANYINTLIIQDSENIIAEIGIYCEAIGEDERYKVLCNNFGYFINNDDTFIFEESDIDEQLPNYELLNRKRKELILEGVNIFPFIGSYKGLINAINYFGFDDLTLKEYWKNIDIESKDYGKYKQVDVIDIYDDKINFNIKNEYLKTHRKTNNIAFSYNINTVTNEYDEYDLPIIKENYTYTIEEVLIKLFALKNKLKKTFLPFNIKIKDIIGEATFFSKITKTVTNTNNTSIFLNRKLEPSIKILSSNKHIIDLRDIDELITKYDFISGFDRNLYANSLTTADNISDVILAAFKNIYPSIKSIENLPDNPNMLIGCPVIIENDTFKSTFESILATFEDLHSNSDIVIDFVCSNVGNGDSFIIRENISNTFIEATALITDDEISITTQLYDLFDNSNIMPWASFIPAIIEENGITKLRIIGKNLGINIRYDFSVESYNGSSLNTQSFNIYYISQTNSKTFQTVGDLNFYEVEWNIKNKDNTLNYTVRGNIDYYRTINVILPKAGKYDLQISLYDTTNMISTKKFTDFIDVKMKEIEFLGIYRNIDKNATFETFGNTTFKSNNIISYNPFIYNDTKFSDLNFTFESLNLINLLPNTNFNNNYIHTVKNFKPSGEESFPGPFTYASIGTNLLFKDLDQLSFRMTEISGDTQASFNIYDIKYGSKLSINSYKKGIHTFNTNLLESAEIELNNSKDEIISNYVYKYVKLDDSINPEKTISLIENNNGILKITSVAHGLKNGQIIKTYNSSINSYNSSYKTVKNITDNTFEIDINFISNDINLRYKFADYIHVAGKYFGKTCDISLIEASNLKYSDYFDSRTYGFLINESKVLKDFKVFNGAIYIIFTSDNCKIPGKKIVKWTITNLTTKTISNYSGKICGHLFWEKGGYSINLDIEDYNGNRVNKSRNIVKIV